MPAVTVEDVTVLPRIPLPDPAPARQRVPRCITTAHRGLEGESVPAAGRLMQIPAVHIAPTDLLVVLTDPPLA